MLALLGLVNATVFPSLLGRSSRLFPAKAGFVVGLLVTVVALANVAIQPALVACWKLGGLDAVWVALALTGALAGGLFFLAARSDARALEGCKNERMASA